MTGAGAGAGLTGAGAGAGLTADGAGALIGVGAGLLAPGAGGGGLTAETCEAAAMRARVPIRRALIMVVLGLGLAEAAGAFHIHD